jgi:hypothetical protein
VCAGPKIYHRHRDGAAKILGLQEIGSNTMFANLRVHGGSNHILGITTGLLQQWYYDADDNDDDDTPSAFSLGWFGSGLIRVSHKL